MRIPGRILADPTEAPALGKDTNDLASEHHGGVRVILNTVTGAVVEPHVGGHLVTTTTNEPHHSGVTPHEGADPVPQGAVLADFEAVEGKGIGDGV